MNKATATVEVVRTLGTVEWIYIEVIIYVCSACI